MEEEIAEQHIQDMWEKHVLSEDKWDSEEGQTHAAETRDLKQWRKDSDNFKGSSEDRDKLFEAMEKETTEEDWKPVACPHCGLDLDEHDGSGFCPPGTEEYGGRR